MVSFKITTPLVLKISICMSICVLIFLRYIFLSTSTIPFTFDHGKDAIAVMHMILTKSPKLIGPWTSIPGLFFGPGWYYVLAPWLFIGGFNPIMPVIAMFILLLLLAWIMNRYFGSLSAFITLTASTWLTISESAWNPFLMPLISLSVLILLMSFYNYSSDDVKREAHWIKLRTIAEWKRWFMLGFIASLGFHFSSAYAIFYPVIIIATIWRYQIKLRKLSLLVLLMGFVLPFAPQLLFELRHNFGEVTSVISYFSNDKAHTFSFNQVLILAKSVVLESYHSAFPNMRLDSTLMKFQQLFWGSLFLWSVLKTKKTKSFFIFEIIAWVIFPAICYLKLHFNYWYLFGTAPIIVIWTAYYWKNLSLWLFVVLLLGFMLTPVTQIIEFFTSQDKFVTSRQFLPVKLRTIEKIRQIANGKSFSVYSYVPDVYDFSYNYLFFWQAYQGMKLPVEMAYKPNAPTYIHEKDDLFHYFENSTFQKNPELIFYIIEQPENVDYLHRWWGEQSFDSIINEYQISPEVTLSVALPK